MRHQYKVYELNRARLFRYRMNLCDFGTKLYTQNWDTRIKRTHMTSKRRFTNHDTFVTMVYEQNLTGVSRLKWACAKCNFKTIKRNFQKLKDIFKNSRTILRLFKDVNIQRKFPVSKTLATLKCWIQHNAH